MPYTPPTPFNRDGMSYHELEAFTGTNDQLDKLIAWKAGSIAVLRHYQHTWLNDGKRRGAHMQRSFHIELRVDFADPEKLEPLKQVLQQAARHAYATAQLISDNPKSTQIAIFSDDFFSGHEEIKLLDDTIQQGLDDVGDTSGSEEVSSELAAAVGGS